MIVTLWRHSLQYKMNTRAEMLTLASPTDLVVQNFAANVALAM